MSINWSNLGNHSWEMAKGAFFVGAACILTNELMRAGNVVNFTDQLLKEKGGGMLVALAYVIYEVVKDVFERMGWQTDSLWRDFAAVAVSVISTFSLAYAGAKGNLPAAYLITGSTVCMIALVFLTGAAQFSQGFKGAVDTVFA